MFLREGFAKGLLRSYHISTWVNFLKTIAEHPEIPDHCSFKGNTFYLMSLLLKPLSHQAEKHITDHSTELANSVNDSLTVIMVHISVGFNYKTLCVPIANEFIDVMEIHHEVLICGSSNFLLMYKKLLLQEVSKMINHGNFNINHIFIICFLIEQRFAYDST